MANAQEFQIIESFEKLLQLRKSQKDISLEKRVLWLIYLKEQKFKTRVELCSYLGITPRTQQRWTKDYINNGINGLLSNIPKQKKSKIITPAIHNGLSQRLNSSDNGFLGYWDAQQWVATQYGVEVKYHWLRQYIIKNFKAKLKRPRKSHYKKDDQAVDAFLKTP